MTNKKKIVVFLSALNSFSCISFANETKIPSSLNTKNFRIETTNVKNGPNDKKTTRVIDKKTNSGNKVITHTVLSTGIVSVFASSLTWYFTKENIEKKYKENYEYWKNEWKDNELDQIAKNLIYLYWVKNDSLSNIQFSEFLTDSKKEKLKESIDNLSFLGLTLYGLLKYKAIKESKFWEAAGNPNDGQVMTNWMDQFKELLTVIEWNNIEKGRTTCVSPDCKLKVDLWIENGVLNWEHLKYNK